MPTLVARSLITLAVPVLVAAEVGMRVSAADAVSPPAAAAAVGAPVAAGERTAAERGEAFLRESGPARVVVPIAPREAPKPVRVREAQTLRDAPKAKVNINAADVKTLMTLTGVTRPVAERIVAYREANGPFRKAEELRKVDGVGNGVWERNRARITVK
jgi:competence protein ComEA